jgi:hypothetical protein
MRHPTRTNPDNDDLVEESLAEVLDRAEVVDGVIAVLTAVASIL